jgi:quercetin dioxygenase-like cupin family protein
LASGNGCNSRRVERHNVGLDNFNIERKGHMSLNDPVLTGPREGRTVTSGHGSSTELKLAGEESGGDWAVVEWRVRAGDEPPIHIHTREDETLYVLDGAITAFVGDQRIEVEAGSYAALPKDVPHGLTVRGEEARLLVTLAPAGTEYFLVPRDENDADPARFGLILQGPAMAA